jgi:hypothetical protein
MALTARMQEFERRQPIQYDIKNGINQGVEKASAFFSSSIISM